MNYKGIIHFHSSFSYDSVLSFKKITRFAIKNKLNFLILTDHESINGSINLQKYLKENKIDIEVPTAMEYKTDSGDLIACFIDSDYKSNNYIEFIDTARKQNGLIFFPHPYKSHKNIEELAKHSDFIEVFNPRLSDEQNNKALNLAENYDKKPYYGSDAHLKWELKNSIIEFDKSGDLRESLLNSQIKVINTIKSRNIYCIISQLIRSVKIKNIKLLFNYFKSFIKLLLTLKLFSKI